MGHFAISIKIMQFSSTSDDTKADVTRKISFYHRIIIDMVIYIIFDINQIKNTFTQMKFYSRIVCSFSVEHV